MGHEKGTSGDVSKARWYILLLSSLYLATFLIRLSFGIITITFPDYTGIEENLSFGFLWAAGPLAEFITVLFVGNLIDKYGRRWALLAGLLGGTLSNALIASSTNYYVLYSVMTLHGFSGGCILVSSLALLADYVPADRRGREIGMFDGVNLAGWGAGFFVGGVLKDMLATHLAETFIVGGILAFVGFVYAFFNLREPHIEGHTVKVLHAKHILGVLSNRSILLLVLPWFILYMLIGDIFAFFPKASGQDFGVAGWLTGLALAAGCIAIVLFQRGYGVLSDRWGRTKLMAVGVVGMIGLLVSVAAIYQGIPGLTQNSVDRDLAFVRPADFVNGNFTQGNGSVTDGTIWSNGNGTVQYEFGPYHEQDLAVTWAKASWIGQNTTMRVAWRYDTNSNDWKYSNLTSGHARILGKPPAEVRYIVILGPGNTTYMTHIKISMHFAPPLDIVKELVNRPGIIIGIGLSAVLSGAFAPAALASLADESKAKARGVTMAIYIVMLSLGQVVGPPVTGYLLDTYGSLGFLFFMVACGIFLALIMMFKWLDKKAEDRKAKKVKASGPEEE
jgi:MFS family permease